MKQPSKRRKKTGEVKGTGVGIEVCNECPFLLLSNGMSICNTSDIVLSSNDSDIIPVPDWCGNKKEKS